MSEPERWLLPPLITKEATLAAPMWAIDGRLTSERNAGAERLPGNVSLPGLVDGHFHMALRFAGIAVGMEEALTNLRAARDAGVLLVRDMGAPEQLSLKLPAEEGLPRVIASGRQLAVEGGFISGSHEPVPPERLTMAALAEVSAGATWVKVLADWAPEGGLTYPLPILREMVDAAHGAGARVAAHCAWSGIGDVVLSGVDSIEHGSWMDESTLRLMADRGVAWAPTSNFNVRDLADIEDLLLGDPESERQARLEDARLLVSGVLDNLAGMVPLAARLGVPLLASTDTVGSVADEVERWIGWGMDREIAVGAATWGARAFLGAAGLVDGAPADVVTFDRDPRDDPKVLHEPRAIVLGGRRLR